ncbi:MAG: prepilin-type N-terminal cleavage/methylation domain-containing protein [Gemmatimonadota bacterium]|nr:prepilin-type N-terminal cleavage/methylation domain-containing protein [Gemmatimonadota bacterium]
MAERGFTLIEAVIVLAVLGILGAASIKLLMTQDRFYSRIDHATLAQQNVRAAADLVSAELRMSGPDDVLAARPDSVSVRFDVYQAVVCEQTGGNGVYVFVYDSVPNPNIAGGMTGTAWSDPYSSTYEYADGWTGTMSMGGAAKTTCVANGSPNLTQNSLYRMVSGWSGNFPSGVPTRGSIVRRYRQLTYRFAPSGMGNGTALFRGPVELVSPLDPASSFSYVMAGGGVQSSVSPGQLGNIRAVRINAIAVDEDPRFDLQRTLQFDIPLRN